MNFYIVIPAHNEENSIAFTLESLTQQTHLPKRVVVVNDNSSDKTQAIIENFTAIYDWITLVNITSSNDHMPGEKVINAFYEGFRILDNAYDIICKFDADIILPNNYLEIIKLLFNSDKRVGIAGGMAYTKKNGHWAYENIANKNHVRGPFKAYKKECFKSIGGLRKSIGWDTVDTLLAQYYGWKIAVAKNLHVKHLKPTGDTYHKSSKYLQGMALYKMRYRFTITFISAIKMAYKKRSIRVFNNYIMGFCLAKNKKMAFIVTKDEGKFIRQLRWKEMLKKLT